MGMSSPPKRIGIAILVGLMVLGLVYSNCAKENKKMAECYKFADEHWFEDKYNAWLLDSVYYNNPDVNSENVCDTFPYWDKEMQEWRYLSHHLPDEKNRQYYVMIGKYDQFTWGWDDYDPANNLSQHRVSYLDCWAEAAKGGKITANIAI